MKLRGDVLGFMGGMLAYLLADLARRQSFRHSRMIRPDPDDPSTRFDPRASIIGR